METIHSKKTSQQHAMYKSIWRWHFYAGILFAPLLVMLAVTGSIYLFKPQIENMMYQDYFEVSPAGERLPASTQLDVVKKKYPEALVTSYRPGESDSRSSEVHLATETDSLTVFVNPYTGNIIGELNDHDRVMDKIEEIHGEIMMGTIGDRIVELAACWSIVLIVTGLYLWFPRKKQGWAGVLFPRWSKGRTTLARDLHAVPAFWIPPECSSSS